MQPRHAKTPRQTHATYVRGRHGRFVSSFPPPSHVPHACTQQVVQERKRRAAVRQTDKVEAFQGWSKLKWATETAVRCLQNIDPPGDAPKRSARERWLEVGTVEADNREDGGRAAGGGILRYCYFPQFLDCWPCLVEGMERSASCYGDSRWQIPYTDPSTRIT